ncbi:MAG TPA: PilZ domain-containing protein [Oligoflexia bacterium]|nr:PilZ domain-containing protein [Oligoflexia bacterium]HMR25571.1 PilZ domain-containing protein [Oligoflexia bacterium]
MTVIERRKSARIETRSKAIIKTSEQNYDVTLIDVSHHGAGCLVKKNIAVPLGQDIQLTLFNSVGTEVFTLTATILHAFSFDQDNNKLGIKFNDINEDKKQLIADYVYQILSQDGGNRREQPRITTRIAMQALPKEKALAILENISMGGLSIICSQYLSVNDPIDIQLPLNNENDLLSCSGKVIHVKEIIAGQQYKVGVQFDNIPNHISKQIEHWMMTLLQQHTE